MQLKTINWTKLSLTALLFVLLLNPSTGAIKPSGDLDVRHKAMYLINLVRYIDWNQEKVTIGIVGDSPVIAELEKLAQKSKRVEIKIFEDPSSINDCNILFLPGIETRSFSLVQNQYGAGKMLIVVDKKNLIHRGAEMGFYVEEEKLKFAVNRHAIDQTGIKVSNSLLQRAKPIN